MQRRDRCDRATQRSPVCQDMARLRAADARAPLLRSCRTSGLCLCARLRDSASRNCAEAQAAFLTSSRRAKVSFLPTVLSATSVGRNLRWGRALPLSQL